MRDALYIDGEWIRGSGAAIEVIDPATGQGFGVLAGASAGDVGKAVDAAERAFHGRWRRTSGAERAELLREIARRVDAQIDALAELEVRDNGKPLAEARWDIEDTAACFRYYAGLAAELDDGQGQLVELPETAFRSRVFREPLGPSALITPWNFPMLMAAWKVAPALAAGCTCVLKPSEHTPLTSLELAHIAAAAGVPAGVLNVVPGHGREAGAALTADSRLRKIAFTGSVTTGQTVMHAAADSVAEIGLELGGKSAALVFDDADVEAVVEWVMFGIFWNKGEVCSATSRLLLQDAIAARVEERLQEEAARVPVGPGLQPGVLLGPLASGEQYRRVGACVERARHAGLTLLTGGGRPPGLEEGFFMEPTIFVDVPTDAELWREEVFGPVLAVRRFSTEDEALRIANASRYGLAAAVFTADEDRLERVSRRLDVGIVWQNCSQPTFVEAPWGGTKHSGIGRELGPWGLDKYLSTKQVTRYTSAKPWGWFLDEPA